jgi:ribosomal-protein-alanine N-acetyltransferase
MQERDLPYVMEIERLSFSLPWKETSFQGEIHNLHVSFPNVIVHRPTDRVIGYIIYWFIGDEGQITNIAVHPDYRNQGIGGTVLRQTLHVIRGMGARHVVLEVRTSNTGARSLYEKFGFTLLGFRRGYYQNPMEDALVLIKYFQDTPP